MLFYRAAVDLSRSTLNYVAQPRSFVISVWSVERSG